MTGQQTTSTAVAVPEYSLDAVVERLRKDRVHINNAAEWRHSCHTNVKRKRNLLSNGGWFP